MQFDDRISQVRLDEFSANEYDRGASRIKEIFWYIIKVLFFLTAIPYPNIFKSVLLKWFGAKVGKGLVLKPRVNIHMPWKLEIGNHCWIGEEVLLLNFEKLQIGNNVCISQRAFICGGNHDYKDPAMSYKNGAIKLNDGCWIGSAVFISPGVTIGTDTVVAAGSVVTKNLLPNGIYKGNPLMFIKQRWSNNEHEF